MKLKQNDQILVTKGKDKGKKAKVLRGFPAKGQILVEGVNVKKVHKRPKKDGEKGQIVEVPYPFDVSKAKFICPKCNKPVRLEYKITDNKKYRVCKKCKAEV
ncbi:MAG: 50S ribosomal protein L24 [Parcubacteria group bacterium]|nr:50S ribosomal protein L24 [Parcubacteria group bacterium]